jgi:hypothetical protein
VLQIVETLVNLSFSDWMNARNRAFSSCGVRSAGAVWSVVPAERSGRDIVRGRYWE